MNGDLTWSMNPGYEWWPLMKYAVEWNREMSRIKGSMYSWKTIFTFAELCWIVHIAITCKIKLTFFFLILCSKKILFAFVNFIFYLILKTDWSQNIFFLFWNILIISPDTKKERWCHQTPSWLCLNIRKLIKIKCRLLLMKYICWKVILHYNLQFGKCHSLFGT